MMGAANPKELLLHLMQADEFGLKLEVVRGDYVWEFFPGPLHQGVVQEINKSVRPSAMGSALVHGCFCLPDVYIQFQDTSVKRPDLSIFRAKPPLTREAVTMSPEAVVEVLSPGTEKKDLDVGPGFYLSQGVKDVVVVNPELAVSFSGGGFSDFFPRPSWQNADVSSWLSTKADPAFTKYFNASGRAYPDISAQGVFFHTILEGEDGPVS